MLYLRANATDKEFALNYRVKGQLATNKMECTGAAPTSRPTSRASGEFWFPFSTLAQLRGLFG